MGRHSTAAPVTPGPRGPRSPWRIGLLAALGLVALATVAGLIALWPGSASNEHVTEEFSRTYALNHPQVTGTVTQTDHHLCNSPATGTAFETPPLIPAFEESTDCTRALVEITSGDQAGKLTQLVSWGVAGDPEFEVGQEIVLSQSDDATFAFADYQRGGELVLWGILAALVIVGFAAWQGLRSLLGLGYSLGVVCFFLLPGLAEGANPLLLALVACSTILLVAIPLVHGLNWKSASSMGGALIALGLAAAIAKATISTTQLQGYSNEEHLKLVLYLPSVSIVGVMLCGFVIGALGGLNDVAIAQASTVTELADADPTARPGRLFLSAMKVGRDHIASMVYTIVLSYTGAALPLLILITAAERPFGQILSSDLVATELLRSGVGAIALTLAVPLTTFIAALTIPRARPAVVVAQQDPR